MATSAEFGGARIVCALYVQLRPDVSCGAFFGSDLATSGCHRPRTGTFTRAPV